MDKNIVQTEEYREIEKQFIKKAEEIKSAKIDRSLPFEEQGKLSYINEEVHDNILSVVKMIRKKIQIKFKDKIVWR